MVAKWILWKKSIANTDMSTMTKKTGQQIHARNRMWQRYGIWLTKKSRRELINLIRQRKARFLGQQSNRVEGWEVVFQGRKIKVLFDTFRGCLITVLPEGAKWEFENEPAIANYDNGSCESVSAEG